MPILRGSLPFLGFLTLVFWGRSAIAEPVLVEFRAAGGASLVAVGDPPVTLDGWDEVMARQRVEARARAIEQARTALVASLPPELSSRITGDYRHFPLLRADLGEGQRQRLESHPQVVAIHDDQQRRALTESSLAFLGASDWQGEGWIGEGTAVAVLDSGIRYWNGFFGDCPEPGAEGCRVTVFEGFATLTWGSGSTDPREVAEYSGHGTNVGGIVGDVAPGTDLLSLGVFAYYEPDPSTGFQGDVLANDGDVAEALDWVIEHRDEYNIVAANMSLGSGVDSTQTGYCSGRDAGAYEAVFANTRAAGVLPVVASGNDYSKLAISPPSCVPSAVTVGAGYDDPAYGFSCGTGPVVPGAVTCFSNSNALIDLVAPGNDIDAGGLYGYGGTSMAAPHVAGLVALYQARYLTSPAWTLERIRADAVTIEEIGQNQTYRHRSARIGDRWAELTFDTGALLASSFDGQFIPDGTGNNLSAATGVICENELCGVDVVGNVYLDLDLEHFGTGDLIFELEAPDGALVRYEVEGDDVFGVEHINSILGSQHLPGLFDALSGSPIEGLWVLRIEDDTPGRQGALYGAALLIDSARVELRGTLEAPVVARPDSPFTVTVALENTGNLGVDEAPLIVTLVDETTEAVIDQAELTLEVPIAQGDRSEHQVELRGPQGAYQVRLEGTLTPDLTPGLIFEPAHLDITHRTLASFVVEPAAPAAGELARLQVVSRGLVNDHLWSFGDGASSTEAEPVHLWPEAGEYEVSLTVTGPDGRSTTARTVTIVEPRDQPDPTLPTEAETPWLNVQGGGCHCQAAPSRADAAGGWLLAGLALLLALLLRRRTLRLQLGLILILGVVGCWSDDLPPAEDGGLGDGAPDADEPEVTPPVQGPWISLLDPPDPVIGDQEIYIMLSSEEATRCEVSLEVRSGDGDYRPATIDGSTPTTAQEATSEGVEHSLLWRATLDVPGDEAAVRLRLSARCDLDEEGESLPVESAPFQVLNFFESNPHAVLISEVSTADENVPAEITADYVELHNTTDQAIALDGWVLSIGAAGGAEQEHLLDGLLLPAGGQLVVAEVDSGIEGAAELTEEIPWSVEQSGAVALIASFGRGVDFVRWGGSPRLPPAELGWTDAPPLPVPQTQTVLARAPLDEDSDSSTDFCVARPSPGEVGEGCIPPSLPSDLLITELDSQGTNDQVEVLNNSSQAVNLSGWVLLWDGGDLGSGHVALAGVEIASGERLVLRDNGVAGRLRGGVLDLGENLNIDGLVPIALALQDPQGQVIDFLAGGGSPIRWVDWEEAEPTPMPGPRTTLSRRPGDPDTDSAADFCLTENNLLAGAEACLEPLDIVLVISEVMPGRPDWIEVYNPGPEAVNLSNVYLSYTAPYYGGSVGDYRLSGTLEPNDFMVISERPLDAIDDELVLSGENISLSPEGDGSVTLRDVSGFGIDFMMWGEPAGRPLWPDQWLGLGADTHTEDDYISIQRFPHDAADTDGLEDWCWAYPSPGNANATCER